MILRQTVAELFDSMSVAPVLCKYFCAQYSITFCSIMEVAGDVISCAAIENVGVYVIVVKFGSFRSTVTQTPAYRKVVGEKNLPLPYDLRRLWDYIWRKQYDCSWHHSQANSCVLKYMLVLY